MTNTHILLMVVAEHHDRLHAEASRSRAASALRRPARSRLAGFRRSQ